MRKGYVDMEKRERRKQKHRDRERERYRLNKDAIKAKQAKYREANRLMFREKSKKYYYSNLENIKKHNAIYRASRRAEAIARTKKWNAANVDRRKANCAAWARQNPDAAKAISARKRAKKRAAVGRLFVEDVKFIKRIFGNACLRCGCVEKITLDHVIPISLGGTNQPTNIQLLCGSCNSSKSNRSRSDYRTKAQMRLIHEKFQLKMFEAA